MNGSPVESSMQNYVTNTLNNAPGQGTQNYLSGVMGQGAQNFGGSMGGPQAQNLNATASGDYLNSNPYLDQMYNNAASRVTETFNDQVMPGINASFAGAGGSGSQIQRELATDSAGELSQTLGQMAGNIYGNNYQNERSNMMNASNTLNQDDLARRGMNHNSSQFNRQLGLGAANASNSLLGTQGSIQSNAASMAPAAANLDYQNIDRMMGVGGAVEGMAGNVLNDDMNRYNYGQQLPDQQLANYISAIQGNYGGTTSTSQDVNGNPVAGGVGGALTGYLGGNALQGALGAGGNWGPWGALLGGLGGYFGS
jgi:hypothetical protein